MRLGPIVFRRAPYGPGRVASFHAPCRCATPRTLCAATGDPAMKQPMHTNAMARCDGRALCGLPIAKMSSESGPRLEADAFSNACSGHKRTSRPAVWRKACCLAARSERGARPTSPNARGQQRFSQQWRPHERATQRRVKLMEARPTPSRIPARSCRAGPTVRGLHAELSAVPKGADTHAGPLASLRQLSGNSSLKGLSKAVV